MGLGSGTIEQPDDSDKRYGMKALVSVTFPTIATHQKNYILRRKDNCLSSKDCSTAFIEAFSCVLNVR